MDNLEYYVLLPNINNERDYKFNVFHSSRFLSCLMDSKARTKKDNTVNIKEEVKHLLQYNFWCKAEYEIIIKSLFEKEEHKIDVYEQVMLNYDVFYDYLMNNWKQIPAKTYRQQNKKRGLI